MANDQAAKRAKLQALRDAYTAGLPQRLAGIEALWVQHQDAPRDEACLGELLRNVHNLAGSAGTFGFPDLGRAARDLEGIISDPERNRALTEGSNQLDIEARIAELKLIARQEPAAIPEPDVDFSARSDVAATDLRRIYLIEDDPSQARETVAQLGAFGWEVSVFSNAHQARIHLQQLLPAAVVVDQMLPEGELAGSELLKEVASLAQYRVPRIMVSSRQDWSSRLAAAQAGADAYLAKPLDYTELANTLDKLTARDDREPYRILVVDDTVELAAHYAQVLTEAHMTVEVINQPSRLLDALTEFKPELILMDIYMPECSGVDAARVVRQDPDYLSVPIVFLSTEAGRDRQLAAMEIGADDFLHKPIDDKQLVAAVTLRAERFRSLAQQINRDSLTGLLNHISFKLQLEAELLRAHRAGSPLTFAMLDIDHFKLVNDNYGHPVGDRVIRSLANLLAKRLRKSDLIGRYGGEEFAVVMPDTELAAGLEVLNEIREHFSRIVYTSADQDFSCTLSVGVAHSGDYTDMDNLIRAADNALYEAKRAGRNRACSSETNGGEPLHTGCVS